MTPDRRAVRRGLALLGLLGLLAVACGAGDDREASRGGGPDGGDGTTTTAPPLAPLTGALLPDDALRNRPALVVKIDNTNKALGRQAGLNAADVVYVEQVEGGATRLAAVFQSTEADPVGPVRSARTTDVDLTANLNRPLLAFSGANQGVLGIVRGANLVDVGVDVQPGAYHERGRGVLRFFVATAALYGLAPPGAGPPPPLFTYRPGGEPVTAAGAEDTAGVRIEYGGIVNPTMTYEPVPEGWARTQDGTAHADAGGARVTPANVVIQFVDYRSSGFVDTVGAVSPEAVLVGEGEAWVLTGGKLVRGRWSRPDPGGPTSLVDGAGQTIGLTPGRTWVELAPPGSAGPLQ